MAVEIVYVAFKENGEIESVIGDVEGHSGQSLNWLEIEMWLSRKEKQGLRIEYLPKSQLEREDWRD